MFRPYIQRKAQRFGFAERSGAKPNPLERLVGLRYFCETIYIKSSKQSDIVDASSIVADDSLSFILTIQVSTKFENQ